MGKTRDLFKKIRDTKGIFHSKMGIIKERNGKDLTKVEGIKKRWQEYTEELQKKGLNDPDNHNGVITHLESNLDLPGLRTAAAAAAKSLQSCPTLCNPIEGSPPGSPVPGILQARTLEWVAVFFSNAGK